MVDYRKLTRDEISKIWQIDRGELIEAEYYVQEGELLLRAVQIDVLGWPEGEAERYTPKLEACFEQGGWLFGAFFGQVLIGVVVLDGSLMSQSKDQLELKFLYVDRGHRKIRLGQKLFDLAAQEAARRGAQRLYISATPTKRTIDFYIRMGCVVTKEPDAQLVKLEPDDIHLEFSVATSDRKTKI